MANKEISALTAATSPDSDDLAHIIEDGNSRKATLAQIHNAWGGWTELSFAGSTNSNLGRTSYLANQTFAVAATDRIEIEVEVEKAENSDATVGIKVGSVGYYIALQSNDEFYINRHNGTSATGVVTSGINVAYDYSGTYHVLLVINVRAATNNNYYAIVNGIRVRSSGGDQDTLINMVGTAQGFVEGTVKRARMRVIN